MSSLNTLKEVSFSPEPGFLVSCLSSDAPFVHLTLTLRCGMGLEKEGEFGYFSLLGTLLGRGCGKLDRTAFALDCDSRGANLSVYPGRDFLTIEIWVLPQDLKWALQTLSAMIWEPRLEATEIKIAVEEQQEQLLARRDEKRARLFDATRAGLFGASHHYGRPLLGDVESLREAQASSLRSFHQRLLSDLSVVLCVTGGVEVERVRSLLSEISFGPTKEYVLEKNSQASFEHPDLSSQIIPFPVEQAEVLLAVPAVPRCHPSYRRFLFCNEILGGAFLSRLTRAVRIHGGLAYSADSRFRAGLEAGVIWVGIQTDGQKAGGALELVRGVMDELREEPLGDEEFSHFKDFVRGSMPFDYDALSSLTSRRLERYLYGESWQLEARLQQFEESATPEKTLETFREFLLPERVFVSALGQELPRSLGESFHRASTTERGPTQSLSLMKCPEPEGTEASGVQTLHRHKDGSLLRLENGLHLLVLPREDVASISVQVWSMTGAMDEEKGKTGLSHLLEHLMFRGTETFPDGAFDAVLAQRGGLNNAFTTEDFTVYTSYVTPEGLQDALVLEADRWQELSVGQEIFDIEKDVVMEERSVRVDCSPLGRAYERLQHLAFGDQPYGQPVIGWREDLENTTREDIQGHYELAKDPRRLMLVIAGGCTVERAVALSQKSFGSFQASPEEPNWPVCSDGEPVELLNASFEEMSDRSGYSYLLCSYRFPREGHPDYEACELLTRIVADGDSCRLYERFVKQERRFLEVWSNFESQARDNPLFFLGFASSQNFEGKATSELVASFLEGLAPQLTEEELEKARRSWIAEEAFGRDELEDWSLELAGRVFLMPWELVWCQADRIRAVTLQDLQRVANHYLKAANQVVVTLQGQSEESAEEL